MPEITQAEVKMFALAVGWTWHECTTDGQLKYAAYWQPPNTPYGTAVT